MIIVLITVIALITVASITVITIITAKGQNKTDWEREQEDNEQEQYLSNHTK